MTTSETQTDESGKGPVIHVAPSPHLSSQSQTTRSMMIDVLIALAPVVLYSLYMFKTLAAFQLAV